MLRRLAITFGILLVVSSNLAGAKRAMGIVDLFGIKTIGPPISAVLI